ncbi:MAG: helicase-associated domain-containing protein [Acidimicrobiales bacterium]|nr:helicase-associated domain-containing protein [Acidimicrobiales bacterium]MCB9392155.1 helicase-associated domain-containing protein [Acidimicrobiaceae bacterium]
MLDEVVSDRLGALDALDAAELARRLALQPHLAAWCLGTGPLRVFLGASAARPGRRQLAGALANPHVQRLTIELLDAASVQLLVVMASRGGTVTADVLDQELEPVEGAERERMVRALVDRFLVHDPDTSGTLRLRPGVGDQVHRPGRPLDRLLLDQSITKDVLRLWLERLGATDVPAAKGARIDALRQLIGTTEGLDSIIDRLSPTEQALFARLVDAGGRGIAGERLTNNWWQLRLANPVEHRPAHLRPLLTPEAAALQFFVDHGLVWVEREIRQVGLWLETLVAFHRRTFAEWPRPEAITPRPLHQAGHAHPDALRTLQSLVHQVTLEPIVGLKTGGIGVKTMRDLAKRLGLPAGQVDLLVHLALGLGLITQLSEFVGRGRTASWVHRFEVNPERLAEWRDLDVADQWTRLVDAWLDALDAPADTRAVDALVRRSVIADLLATSDGHGIPADRFTHWIAHQHVMATRVDVTRLADHLVVLGLAPPDGPVGLGALARTVLTEPDSLHALLPDQDRTFVVQADLSVIAPPALDPVVRARLDRLCVAESSGSVNVLRLDRTRIAAEMASGATAESLLEFVTAHSSVPIAPVVAQVFADVERQRGGLTARGAATVVTADDVLGLAAAVKVRAARLTLLAPTVAISDLPLDKVLGALRKAGLAPSTDADPVPAGDVVNRVQATPRVRQVPPVLHPSTAHLEALLETW